MLNEPPSQRWAFGLRREVDLGRVVRADDAVPADAERPEPLDPVAADVEQPGPLGPEQPLVAVGGQEVDRRPPHVDRQRAEPLDRVDEEGDAARPAELAERVEVVAEPRGELDVADRQDPRRVVDRRGQVLDPDPPVAARDGPQARPRGSPGSSRDRCSRDTPRRP